MKATHNSARPSLWYRNAAIFLSKVLHGGLKDTETLFQFDDDSNDEHAKLESMNSQKDFVSMPKSFHDSNKSRSDDSVVTIASSPSCSSSEADSDCSDESEFLEVM